MSQSTDVKATGSKQISVFLENHPGTLAELASFLGEKGVNIYALTLTGGIDHGSVRMVVDDHDTAVRELEKAEYLTFERDVILLEIPNAPGAMGGVMKKWSAAGINVEYAYCAGGPNVTQGLVVVRVDDTKKALEVLGE